MNENVVKALQRHSRYLDLCKFKDIHTLIANMVLDCSVLERWLKIQFQQKQTHRYKEHTCGCQGGEGEGEGWTGNLGLVDTNYYYI